MAKKAITVYLKEAIENGFKTIKRNFLTIQELNENFKRQRDWIFENVDKRKSYVCRLARVLEIIKLHSCKYFGISYLTENNLCQAYCEQFGESISKRSIVTYLSHLKEVGFITSISTKRKDGKQSANILVLEKLEVKEEGSADVPLHTNPTKPEQESTSCDTEQKPAHKTRQNLHTQKTQPSFKTTFKDSKERQAGDNKLLNFVPRWFKEKIACCASEAKAVYEYWKVSKQVLRTRALDAGQGSPDLINDAIRELYKAAKAASRGKFVMDNPFGFYHELLRVEVEAHVRRAAGKSIDWLK